MGNTGTKITEEELEQYTVLTKFDRDEIARLYKLTMKGSDHASTYISQEQCSTLLNSLGISCDFLSQLLFGVLDQNGDGLVDFRELLMAMNTAINGDMEQKVELMFKIYDINDDGFLAKTELLKIFTAIFTIKKESKRLKGIPIGVQNIPWETPESAVEEVFKLADLNGDELISKQEFETVCQTDTNFLNSFNFFKSTKS
eukprot:TRINITY_DN2787_c0_g1_i4.p1 TRINITY_DN2787_c0_g1~~TRINITY_DN2787_c0_g1_i4.p1  ORF type:complete len:232 (-),score=42.67 TRINITY_DN2787_c0_g1_i4:76-675(-)